MQDCTSPNQLHSPLHKTATNCMCRMPAEVMSRVSSQACMHSARAVPNHTMMHGAALSCKCQDLNKTKTRLGVHVSPSQRTVQKKERKNNDMSARNHARMSSPQPQHQRTVPAKSKTKVRPGINVNPALRTQLKRSPPAHSHACTTLNAKPSHDAQRHPSC
jgi:hypothetical protein